MAKALEHKQASVVVIVAVTLLSAIASFILYRYINHLYHPIVWFVPLFFFVATAILSLIVGKIKGEDARKDTNRLMIYKTAKLIVSLAFLLIAYFGVGLSREAFKGFALLFWIDYMILLGFEFLLLRNNEQANKERKANSKVTK